MIVIGCVGYLARPGCNKLALDQTTFGGREFCSKVNPVRVGQTIILTLIGQRREMYKSLTALVGIPQSRAMDVGHTYTLIKTPNASFGVLN